MLIAHQIRPLGRRLRLVLERPLGRVLIYFDFPPFFVRSGGCKRCLCSGYFLGWSEFDFDCVGVGGWPVGVGV
jgi:hypothetical protein